MLIYSALIHCPKGHKKYLHSHPGSQSTDSTQYYYGDYRYHARYPYLIKDIMQNVRDMIAKGTVFTGLSILHKLYETYGIDILKDLVFNAMHNVALNVVGH